MGVLMNQIKILLVLILGSLSILGNNVEGKVAENANNIITETNNLELDTLTPEILCTLGRVGGTKLSPDGKYVTYTVTYYNIEDDNSSNDIYSISVNGGSPIKLTNTSEKESNVIWRPDGKKIGYISSKSGDMQIWEMNPDGSENKQISNINGGISNFKYSPKGDKIIYIKSVKLDRDMHDLFPDLPLANARLETDLMYRHWDEWHNYSYDHVFIADYKKSKIGDGKDIIEGEKFDIGGFGQMSFSPDGKFIAYSCKKLIGKDFAVSTNTDIYLFDIKNGETTNITEGMMGYDRNPVFSLDGKSIMWSSMERDGYEADRNRIFIMNLKTGSKVELSVGLDRNCGSPQWSKDGKTIYFSSPEKGTYQLYSIDVTTKTLKQITSGQHNYHRFIPSGDHIIASKESMSTPCELYKIDISTGKDVALTDINKEIMDNIKMGDVKERWVKTTDGKEMLVWMIYPPDFDPNKEYPALLYCQGGPQGTVSQSWSPRWNFQLMAANNYIVVAPNRRGLPSFGQEWNEQISGDWGGQAMKDLLSAIDDVKKEPYVDENRLGAVGASFGGYSVFWLAGNHDKRFKAFISHAGIFNLESWYNTTEEMFFANWDLKGSFWNENRSKTWDTDSPHKYIANWDTPILVIHGGKDFRVPEAEGMQAFQVAQLQDIPSQFLYFPEENHWVMTPQNGILWQRVFFQWLDQWLK
jgi:dipeptidyl aminopeptidase/acylaminoacyl peptidase